MPVCVGPAGWIFVVLLVLDVVDVVLIVLLLEVVLEVLVAEVVLTVEPEAAGAETPTQ
jgi:hypothetical protein